MIRSGAAAGVPALMVPEALVSQLTIRTLMVGPVEPETMVPVVLVVLVAPRGLEVVRLERPVR